MTLKTHATVIVTQITLLNPSEDTCAPLDSHTRWVAHRTLPTTSLDRRMSNTNHNLHQTKRVKLFLYESGHVARYSEFLREVRIAASTVSNRDRLFFSLYFEKGREKRRTDFAQDKYDPCGSLNLSPRCEASLRFRHATRAGKNQTPAVGENER